MAESSAAFSSPVELIDPDGEGIYYHDSISPNPLLRAAQLFFGTASRWREIDHKTVWLQPNLDGDEWVPANIGRFPYGWRLNLPKRWFRGERYAYCTPKPEAM